MIIKVYTYKNTSLPSNLFKRLIKDSFDYTKINIKKTKNYKEKCIKVINDFILKSILYEQFNLKYNKNRLIINLFGKPFLKNSHIHFNISHNFEYSTIAIGTIPVGIDIENNKSFKKETKTFFISKKEEILYNKNPNLNLCKIWTGKESYCKLIGNGLTIPLKKILIQQKNNSFSVYFDNLFTGNIVKFLNIMGKTNIAVCSNQVFLIEHFFLNMPNFIYKKIKKHNEK